jgi:hypothetical protein
VTNEPNSASGHEVTVTEGCVVIEQTYEDEFNGYKTENLYYTYFNGTGTAESYVTAVPGMAESIQLSNGTGSAYAAFSQIVYSDDTFDYSVLYGGGTWYCAPGYVGLFNAYNFYTSPGYYNPELGLYCIPVYEDYSVYAFLNAESTDEMDVSAFAQMDSVEWYQDVEAEGESQYDIVISSYDDLDFDLEMLLG